jgi:hypothetical protein
MSGMLLLTSVPSHAHGQIAAPDAPTGGTFGRRNAPDPMLVTQELTVTVDSGTGYDSNRVSGGEQDLPLLFGPQPSGHVSFGAATLGYKWGRQARYIAAHGGGYASYASAGINQVWNGNVNVRGAWDVNRRLNVKGGVSAVVSPIYLFEAIPTSIEGFEDVATNNLHPQGVTEQKWRSTEEFVEFGTNWTRRQSTSVRYTNSQMNPLEGFGLDSASQLATVSHVWQAGRSLGVYTASECRDNRQEAELGGQHTFTAHRINFGINGTRRLSAVRTLNYLLEAGVLRSYASYAEGIPSAFVQPNFSAGLAINLTRSWTLSARSSRNTTVLQGFAPEPMAVDSAALDLGGNLSRRLQLRIAGNYSRGTSRSGAGEFDSAAASANAQYALSRHIAVFAAYSYYDHKLHNIITALSAFPDRYQRHSISIGSTVWLPVVGRF